MEGKELLNKMFDDGSLVFNLGNLLVRVISSLDKITGLPPSFNDLLNGEHEGDNYKISIAERISKMFSRALETTDNLLDSKKNSVAYLVTVQHPLSPDENGLRTIAHLETQKRIKIFLDQAKKDIDLGKEVTFVSGGSTHLDDVNKTQIPDDITLAQASINYLETLLKTREYSSLRDNIIIVPESTMLQCMEGGVIGSGAELIYFKRYLENKKKRFSELKMVTAPAQSLRSFIHALANNLFCNAVYSPEFEDGQHHSLGSEINTLLQTLLRPDITLTDYWSSPFTALLIFKRMPEDELVDLIKKDENLQLYLISLRKKYFFASQENQDDGQINLVNRKRIVAINKSIIERLEDLMTKDDEIKLIFS